MTAQRVTLILFVFTALFSLVIGCGGSDSETVAKVGDYNITVKELGDFFQNARFPFSSAEDEFNKKREVLDTMVVNRLLVQAAYEKNIDKLEELSRVVLANKDKFLLDVLYARYIVDKSDITDMEVKDFYDRLEYKVRASHILLDNPDTAQALVTRLEKGESFEKLAFEYSIDPSAKRNQGDLGYFLWGAMVDEFAQAAFAMEPGEISPPVKSRFGYHIIKLVDRLPNDQRTNFESMKSDMERQLTGIKRRNLMEEYFNSIKERYPVTIDTTTCSYLVRKREMLYPPQLLETLPNNDFDTEQLDRNERELILATWDGGQMTIIEYLQQAKQIPSNIKPGFDDFDSLATIVFELKKMEILTYEAIREGLDKDPEFSRKVTLFKELSMADIMRNDSLPKPLPPNESMMRKYYDEHLDDFTDPAKVHIYEILLSDELKARRLKDELNSLDEFKQNAMNLSERPGKQANYGDLGYIERKWFPEIFDMAIKTPVGEIGGPVITRGKYSIFYVADRLEAEQKDFLDVKAEITRTLNTEQENTAFLQWVEERKENTDIEIFEDVIWSTIDNDKYAAMDTTSEGN